MHTGDLAYHRVKKLSQRVSNSSLSDQRNSALLASSSLHPQNSAVEHALAQNHLGRSHDHSRKSITDSFRREVMFPGNLGKGLSLGLSNIASDALGVQYSKV